jgi:L-seryl-tRNA(Ser) seleniumtransferase
MISSEVDGIKKRAESWRKALKQGKVIQSTSMVGGGSLPGETLPTWALALNVDHPNQFLDLLRQGSPPLIGRVENDLVLFDPRTVDPDFDQKVNEILIKTWSKYEN